ncbi:MAG: hypothetical protein VX529_10930 [Pseudomonadota bacterium]|nr:hypothetical protein [Pseudomonadota bacterium]
MVFGRLGVLGQMSTLGMSSAASAGGGGGFSWTNAEGEAFAAAMSGTYSDAKLALLDTYISNLKSGLTNGTNTWGGHDVLSLLFLDNATDALRWFNSPATLMTNNGATHTPGEGYTGNGSSSYINSNYNPSTDGVQYTQNSASMGLWVRSAGSNAAAAYAGLDVSAFIGRGSDVSELSQAGPNGGFSNNEVALSTTTGLLGINRSGASAIQLNVNGAQDSSDTDASSAPANGTVAILAQNDLTLGVRQFSNAQISIFRAGRSFTAAEWVDIHAADDALLTGWASA